MFLYYTRGLMRWVGGVHCGDTGAMKAEGQARTTESPLLVRRMRAALCLGCCSAPDGEAFAFCLLRCCCSTVPCPLTPGEQTGQRPSPLLMVTRCSRHCPQSLVSPVSPVLWVLRHSVGHLRQPWDTRDRARQEPRVGARCPVTPVDGMISGYDYDYDYIYIYIYIYIIYIYVCVYIYVYIYIYIYI